MRRRPGHLSKVLCTFNLRPVFRGYFDMKDLYICLFASGSRYFWNLILETRPKLYLFLKSLCFQWQAYWWVGISVTSPLMFCGPVTVAEWLIKNFSKNLMRCCVPEQKLLLVSSSYWWFIPGNNKKNPEPYEKFLFYQWEIFVPFFFPQLWIRQNAYNSLFYL